MANENNLFDMSPMHSRQNASDGSLSFNGSKQRPLSDTLSAMSTDSVSRAPFGELQNNAFEFKTMQAPNAGGTTKAPFANMMKQAESAVSEQDQTPATPASVVSESRGISKADASPRSPIVWSDILMWQEPLQSLCIFVGGLLLFGLVTFAAYGAHKMTLVSGVAYLLLLDMGANFFRYFVSEPWHAKCLWGGAAQMKHVLTRVNSIILRLAAAHDRYLSAADPFITLKVAGALWALAWVGSFVSLWWCCLLAYIGAFTLPGIYSITKDQMASTVKSIRAQTLDKVDAAGLPRTVRFVTVAAAVALLFFTTSWVQSAIGFFVATTYWRTLLVPREIDMIRTAAEPYTQSVRKVGRRISTVAEDAFVRMSTTGPATRTKSHFRAE